MKNQENFTTRSSIKVKVHWAKTSSSYLIRFPAGILFPSLVLFAFCIFIIFYTFDYAGGRMIKKNFTRPISGNKTTFCLALLPITQFLCFSHFPIFVFLLTYISKVYNKQNLFQLSSLLFIIWNRLKIQNALFELGLNNLLKNNFITVVKNNIKLAKNN